MLCFVSCFYFGKVVQRLLWETRQHAVDAHFDVLVELALGFSLCRNVECVRLDLWQTACRGFSLRDRLLGETRLSS